MLSYRGMCTLNGLATNVGLRNQSKALQLQDPCSVRALTEFIHQSNSLGKINHIFVLVLENRSFDHLFGFSNITGRDPETGELTPIEGLTGKESNKDSSGKVYTVTSPAPDRVSADPGHEFLDAKLQLCGTEAGTAYIGATINNSGFVKSAERVEGLSVSDVMSCFQPSQIPVLSTLAREFAICDHWFSSLPGPTFPNRFFLHAATSEGIDWSPAGGTIAATSFADSYSVPHGHIYDKLDKKDLEWYIYEGDWALAQCLDGIDFWKVVNLEEFYEDISDPGFDGAYTFIEPCYFSDYDWFWESIDVITEDDYASGNSMHPLGAVSAGEKLVKDVYEAIRNSPHWNSSLLVITFDEHGGFYDHVAPPKTVRPTSTFEYESDYGFDFTQLGVRVPALIISPYVARNQVDHTVYDHASLLKTVENRFGLNAMTQRDTAAHPFSHLLRLGQPRTDAPTSLNTSTYVTNSKGSAPDMNARVATSQDARPKAPTEAQRAMPASQLSSWGAMKLKTLSVTYGKVASEQEKAALKTRLSTLTTLGQVHDLMMMMEKKLTAIKAERRETRNRLRLERRKAL